VFGNDLIRSDYTVYTVNKISARLENYIWSWAKSLVAECFHAKALLEYERKTTTKAEYAVIRC